MKNTILSLYGVNISKPPKIEVLGYFPLILNSKNDYFPFFDQTTSRNNIIIIIYRFLGFRFYTQPTFLSNFLIRTDFLHILYV